MHRVRVAVLCGIVALTAGGCITSHSLGYAGQNPGRFSCKGKVAITIAVAGQVNAVYSGGNLGSISANGDCGDSFVIEQGQPLAPVGGNVSITTTPK